MSLASTWTVTTRATTTTVSTWAVGQRAAPPTEPAPPERTLTVCPESRVYVVPADDRCYVVMPESRLYIIPAEEAHSCC